MKTNINVNVLPDCKKCQRLIPVIDRFFNNKGYVCTLIKTQYVHYESEKELFGCIGFKEKINEDSNCPNGMEASEGI